MSIASAATALLAAALLAVPVSGPAAGPRAEAPPAVSPGAVSGIALSAEPEGGSATWTWPLHPRPAIVRPFTPPEQRWLSGHRGVDLHAPGPGVAILAPSAGRVRFSGRVGGKDVVVIEHAQGLRSTFEPAISSLAVGAAVSRGQAVAAVGPSSGHCAPTTCLHWGVLRGEVYLDPLSFIGPLGVRLLPLR